MEENKVVLGGGGIGSIGLLGVAFVVMKIMGIITWSWWAVLLPFYAGFVLIIAIAFIVLFFALILSFFS